MSLTRHWYPSPNYSSGGKKRLIVLHTTEGFTGTNGMYDCAIYFQGPSGASSHVVIDNYHPGHVCEGVNRNHGAWTQCGYNSVCVSAEQCGYASWSRDTWLNDKSDLLKNTAQWIAEESSLLGIPITRLTASQAQGNNAGICGHSDLGSAGCGHSDPGSGYPWDVVLDWARNGIAAKPPTVEEVHMTPASAYDMDGRLHHAAINQRFDVCYKGPNGNWYPVSEEEWHKAQSGVSMVISPDNEITITFTQRDGDAVHMWQKFADNPEQWRLTRLGASYQ
jgi:hypothetical protein